MKKRSYLLQYTGLLASTAAITISLFPSPLLAQDPFRNNNPQPIGSNTETAFKELFERGNYKAASDSLDRALSSEPNEPLAYAMKASLAYLQEDWQTFSNYAIKTREIGEKITPTNPLRGNLYTAVGHFLEGADIFIKEGTVKGTPQALTKLRQVFQYLETAEKISPQDPEVNLLKGYMDLILSTNLPFSDPAEAIQRLQTYAGPQYLALRGIAIGHRNLKEYDQAIAYVDQAIATTPNNPELYYLKAQILFIQKKHQQAQPEYKMALTKPDQMPKELVQEIFFEQCRNQNRIDNKARNCDALRDKIREEAGVWAPSQLPSLD